MNAGASKREDSGSEELHRKFTRDEVKGCVARIKSVKAAGANEKVNYFGITRERE